MNTTPDPATNPDNTPQPDLTDLTVLRAQPAPVGDPRSEALWVRQREGIIRDRDAAHDAFAHQVALAQDALTRRLTRIDDAERALLARRGQTVVLVRGTVTDRAEVYHRADGGCGWSIDRRRYIEMFESEARSRGLRRCSCRDCW